MQQAMGSRNAQTGFSMTKVSAFVAKMQEALIRYERAKDDPDKRSAAEREMAELIKAQYRGAALGFDYKAAQAKDGE